MSATPLPLPEQVLQLLACPVCRGVLGQTAAEITCAGCGRRYPVRDGIPVLIAEAAAPPPV